jgi:hydroxyacylglutathione hydrolase
MNLERIVVPGLAHYSYVLSSGGRAAVIDPKRDVDTYLAYAAARDLKITHILETHIHADFASGARDLARATGAELWLSGHDQGEDFVYQFERRAMAEGDRIELDGVAIVALHTPGHTPEHLSFLVHDPGQSKDPVALLSGDFLFVGSLGRPDLLGEGAKQRLAELLYESLHEKIRDLPDGVAVYPAHGAGSFCGSGMSHRPESTLGRERLSNSFFADPDRASFVRHILGNVPPFPSYYRRMKRVNSEGPRLLDELPGGQAIAPARFREWLDREETVVVDLRSPKAFGAGHIPGALNIGAGSSLSTWAAWLVPYDRPILLVNEEGSDPEPARRSLVRVGLDDVRGSLEGGMASWRKQGWEQREIEQVTAVELEERRRRGPTTILDVRSAGEWAAGHIEGSRHVMGGDLPERLGELPRDTAIHVICATGYRAGVAASLLRRAGFTNVVNVSDGLVAWKERGLPLATGA